MKIPDNYIKFKNLEEQIEKYREWGFGGRKKNELTSLMYKGIYLEGQDNTPEECIIIGYYNDTELLIELKDSKKRIIIDRNYLKHMQDKYFNLDQDENDIVIELGKEIIDIIDDYIVYDIETTGFSNTSDEIIEIAAVKVKDGRIIDEFQSLVRPTISIPKSISKLTGITDSMVSDACSINDVIFKFRNFVGDSILVGHNIKTFDNYFIAIACSQNNIESITNSFIDTLTIAKKLYPELPSKKINQLKDYLQIELQIPQHRALNDCYFEVEIYERMKKDIIKNFSSIERFNSYRPLRNLKTNNSSHSKNNKKTYPKHDDLRQLESTKTEFDETNIFFGKNCVFTGELSKYSREEAAQIVVDLGGKCENHVTKKTNYLIVSDDSDPNKKTSKQKKAEEYKLKGQDIEIIPESVFYDIINE